MTAFAKLRIGTADYHVAVDDIGSFRASYHNPAHTVIRFRSGPVEQISLDLEEVKRRLTTIPGVWLDDGSGNQEAFQVGHIDQDNDDDRSYREGLSRLRGPNAPVSRPGRERLDGGTAE